jgi:hypothetical protein
MARALINRIDPKPIIGLADEFFERRALQDAIGQLPPVVAGGGEKSAASGKVSISVDIQGLAPGALSDCRENAMWRRASQMVVSGV